VEVIPAIDLKDGRCVRLLQGDFQRETVFSDDPLSVAYSWQRQGAGRLHLVDLDGAARGEPAHLDLIRRIIESLDIPVQVGGGIRSVATANSWLDAGADRVVIGTAAVRNPEMVRELCGSRGAERVVVAVDAKEGEVAVQGWAEGSSIDVLHLAGEMERMGVTRLLYTDIARDGMMAGPDHEYSRRLVQDTGMAVLASGGVASVDDIRGLVATGVEGVIVGRALYSGAVALAEAIAAVSA
jgi:phosphoribosylformimino-5-aminoimidazole carboxamide ribotide isomerase